MAPHLPPLSSHQPFALSLFLQSGETLCGEVLEGGAGGRLHQAAMQRDPPRRRPAAELQRPRPAVPHRDGHTGRGDQPQAETGCPQLLRPGEAAAPYLLFPSCRYWSHKLGPKLWINLMHLQLFQHAAEVEQVTYTEILRQLLYCQHFFTPNLMHTTQKDPTSY